MFGDCIASCKYSIPTFDCGLATMSAIQSVLCNHLLLLINYPYVLACTHMIVKRIILFNNSEIYINLLVYVNSDTKVRDIYNRNY